MSASKIEVSSLALVGSQLAQKRSVPQQEFKPEASRTCTEIPETNLPLHSHQTDTTGWIISTKVNDHESQLRNTTPYDKTQLSKSKRDAKPKNEELHVNPSKWVVREKRGYRQTHFSMTDQHMHFVDIDSDKNIANSNHRILVVLDLNGTLL
ncbi:hypothetical protein EV182_006939, partial [Spiromyces aspiralis]